MQVTAARYPLPIADRLIWRYAPLDAEVVCTSAVLETIRHQAAQSRSRLSHSGLESGGILLGRRTDRSMEIVGALSIECEHKLGPLFILSAADEKALDATLASDKLGTLRPVGLYVSHSRQGFAVAEAEAKILDRLAAGPWQLVLVVVPARFGPARAGFFIRGAVDRSFVCVHELLLSPMERVVPAATPAATRVGTGSVPHAVRRNTVHVQAVLGRVKSLGSRAKSLATQVKGHWKLSQWNMAASVILLLLFVSAGGLFMRARAVPSTSIPMHVSDLGSNVRIEWDPAQKAVRSASHATLEIRDGQSRPVTIPVTRGELDNGSVMFIPHSDNIEVRLKLMRGNALSSESVLYFINPERHVNASTGTPVSAPVVSAPLVAAKLSPAKVSTPIASPAPVLSPTASAPLLTSTASQNPPPVAAPETEQPIQKVVEKRAKPDRERQVKTFQLPVVQARNETPHIAPMSLPDLPEIHTSAPAPPLASGSPLVAVLTAPAHFAGPPQLRGGRLIWTGSLHKNAVLTITPGGASSGVLSGSLPGVPVKISLQPAELLDGGIAVFSKDPERTGADQPPSAWNGWKVEVHEWDPKRIAEVSLVEPPGPANNWKRLVLRNGNRNVSVFVVNWQRE
jgi:hypothetical protein